MLPGKNDPAPPSTTRLCPSRRESPPSGTRRRRRRHTPHASGLGACRSRLASKSRKGQRQSAKTSLRSGTGPRATWVGAGVSLALAPASCRKKSSPSSSAHQPQLLGPLGNNKGTARAQGSSATGRAGSRREHSAASRVGRGTMLVSTANWAPFCCCCGTGPIINCLSTRRPTGAFRSRTKVLVVTRPHGKSAPTETSCCR